MSLPTLYELADEFKDALENLTDLDNQAVIDTLESLEGEFKLKSSNVAKYIKNLENTKKALESSERQFRLANDKAQDLTIKRLTKDSPSLSAEFDKTKSIK